MDEDLAPGTVVAQKYTIERVIGRGGMGVVYLVTHRVTGKRLALKCLLRQHGSVPEVVERFEREARATGRVQHRHVVDVFDVGRDGSLLFLVMEYLEGKPLSELLAQEPIPVGALLRIMLRAMEGVAAAHDHGILHRDLKPANIFVCAGVSGQLDDPRVLDFGVSKLEEEHSASLTLSGIAMGTPTYMPLEQLTGRRDLDARADIYALGVILYEALAGQPPHDGDNMASLAIRVATAEALDLARLRPDLPLGLCAAIMKAIARERAQRQSSVRELIECLRPYASEEALSSGETRRRTHEEGGRNGQLPPAWASPSACTQPATPPGLPDADSDAVTRELAPPSADTGQGSRRHVVFGTLALLAGGVALAWLLREGTGPAGERAPRLAAPVLEPRTPRAYAAAPAGEDVRDGGGPAVDERDDSARAHSPSGPQASEASAPAKRAEGQRAPKAPLRATRLRASQQDMPRPRSAQREPARTVGPADAPPSDVSARPPSQAGAGAALRTSPLSPDEF